MVKLSLLSILVLPVYAWAATIAWNVANTPSTGLKDITFPFNIANATHIAGYYFAQQFSFVNAPAIGYTGLQPRPDQNGKSIIHGVFSSFINGTSTRDTNCHMGADNGPGVSCSVEVASDYSHTYNLVVENTSGTTWRGTMVDTVSGVQTRVGSWTLPTGIGGIRSRQLGFIEYYRWNDKKDHPCSSLPKTSVFFGIPTTSTASAVGSLGYPYDTGKCSGKVNLVSSRSPIGVWLSLGFPSTEVASERKSFVVQDEGKDLIV
ncbi:hypothetical protein C8Q75DRAFT_587712 [Abortiporus biennis]|nr:hypothetical protein C8Q75DRAFT_587712 [Abortiporus biennis]